jgi:3-oxoacyl-[acyl-carrier protein] reductase
MTVLHNKIAIVTGGAAGFGEGIVRLFVEQGARVLIADLDLERAQALATSLGAAAFAVQCDVSRAQDVQTASMVASIPGQ